MPIDDEVLARIKLRRRLPPPSMRRQLREQAGVSQSDIAAVVGVSRECVSMWESGPRVPRGQNLERYLAFLERLARESV
jgi:DNA-binding transcriptional regulator YiaG